MEGVEGLMEKLNLSEAKRKIIKLDGDTEGRSSKAPIQAFGQLFSERGSQIGGSGASSGLDLMLIAGD
jgi:hypothetical protein